MIDLTHLTITSAREKLDTKEFSAVDLAKAYLNQIKNKNPELNAYLEVYEDVLVQAKMADERIARGESTPLLGIPMAIKDNIVIKGRKSTSGSKILEGFISPYNATVIDKLQNSGAVLLGRTNMDEFALGSSTENSAFGVTKNPYDLERVSGGTSGGSASAVGSDMALGALGSDTGGSVRQPSAFCGVVGLKPTYGNVSRYGLMASASSFDVIGTIAKTVEDVQIIFEAIKGDDPLDSTTITGKTYKEVESRKPARNATHSVAGGSKVHKVIGVPWDLINGEGIDSEVKKNLEESVEKLKSLGFEIKDVKLPNCLALYYIINFAEVSSNLARFDGVKYGLHIDGKDLLEDYLLTRGKGLGKESRRRILLGTYVLSAGYYDAYYGKAQTARIALKQ